jgi:glycine cleavage system H protein
VADELTFEMGKYAATFPADRLFARNHHWFQELEAGSKRYRVGLTMYAVRLLRDVYFLDWQIDPGDAVKAKQEIGEIESSKAVSSLYVPFAGRVVAFNDDVLSDPSAINVDCYGSGWLYDFETEAELLTPEQYLAHMQATWDDTQRMIKGQMNEG